MEQQSLDQMLAAIPPQLLDQKIANDIHLAELARSLKSWRAAISYLGLRETDEEAIEEENSKLDAQRHAVLRKWRQKYGPTATYRNLAKCFYNADKPEMVEAVCKVLQPNAPPPQPAAQHQPAAGYYPPPGAYQQPPPPGQQYDTAPYQPTPTAHPPGAYQQPPPPGAYQQPPPPGQQYYTAPYQPAPTAQFVGQNQGMLKPTEKQLMIELRNTVASEWRPIGTFLEIPGGEMSIIADRHRGDPQNCLMAMLAVWLPRTNPPPCWPDIADAVDFVGRPDVAEVIRQKYCVPGMQPQPAGPVYNPPQSQGMYMYSHQQMPQLSGQAPHMVQPQVQWQAPSANYGIPQQNTSQFYPQQAATMQPVQSGGSHGYPQQGGSHGYPQQQSGMILAERDLYILTEILKPAVPQWREIGGALGILEYDLNIIQHKPTLIVEGSVGYLREALTQWLKWAPPNHHWPTIEALALAVQSIGQEGLAFNLKSLFLQKKGVQPQPTGPVYNPPQAQPMYPQQIHQPSGHAPQMQPPVQVAGSGVIGTNYQGQQHPQGYQPPAQSSVPQQSTNQTLPSSGSAVQYQPDSAGQRTGPSSLQPQNVDTATSSSQYTEPVQESSSDSGEELEGSYFSSDTVTTDSWGRKRFELKKAYDRCSKTSVKLSFAEIMPTEGLKQAGINERYDMHCHPHGIAVIINNKEFKPPPPSPDPVHKLSKRVATDTDESNLSKTFRFLGYNVEIYREPKASEMLQIFKRIVSTRSAELATHDSFVCCILSHGEDGKVFGSDSALVELTDIASELRACTNLNGKPKMFFTQACRGKEGVNKADRGVVVEPRIVADSGSKIASEADFFFSSATPSGYVAWHPTDKEDKNGSPYIKALCQTLCTNAKHTKLVDMHTKINNEVSQYETDTGYKQVSEPVDRLRKDVYFL